MLVGRERMPGVERISWTMMSIFGEDVYLLLK